MDVEKELRQKGCPRQVVFLFCNNRTFNAGWWYLANSIPHSRKRIRSLLLAAHPTLGTATSSIVVIGNFARTKRDWGYVNGALSSIFTEVFLCGLATVFLGRLLKAAFTYPPYQTRPVCLYMITVASLAMLISMGFEMLWALWMLKRSIEQKGRAEAQDMDSLLLVVLLVVPVTAVCSWLICIAFLYAAEGPYCPGTIKWVALIWGLVPLVANICRTLIEYSTQ